MIKKSIHKLFSLVGLSVFRYNKKLEDQRNDYKRLSPIYAQFKGFTMIPLNLYQDNLKLAEKIKSLEGNIVECGVWRGGMIAGIAKLLGNERTYFLFDSFEGLPEAKAIDGADAVKWQNKPDDPNYFDNCKAEISFAENAMHISGARDYKIVKGWFEDTLLKTNTGKIALLRLDADWYESTKYSLETLYDRVVDGGVIVIDDYYFWDGCTKAVHEFLHQHQLSDRIHETENGVAYIIKNEKIKREW